MNNKWLMAKKSLNMMEKMMVPNMNDYYIIYCAIPSIIAIENRYQIDFGTPDYFWKLPTQICYDMMSMLPRYAANIPIIKWSAFG